MIHARALAGDIAAGRISAAAAIESARATIAEREPAIGAFAHLAAAGRVAAEGPLAGISIGIKDIIDTADMPTGMGSAIWQGWQPRADAAVVARARASGAALLGKTTTTAFAHLEPTATDNPRAPGHTPGGSSSGSAAAIAAGMAALAFGTQTGGSIIRPASFCGVTGVKPSFRLLPTAGVKCFSWALDTVGLFGADVFDAAFGLAALTGRRELDIGGEQLAAPRLHLVRQDFAGEASPAAEAALATAASRAGRAGARIEAAELPPVFAEAFAAHGTIQDFEALQALGWEWMQARDRLPKVLADQLAAAEAITPQAYDAARRSAKRARLAARALFEDGALLLTYAAPGAAPRGHGSTGSSHFNRLWTLLGTPCVAVAGLTDDAGRPIGVQVVGPFGRDRETLAAAAFVERAIRS